MNEKEIMELVDKAIAKDNQAMETLYKTYYKDVLYVCKKLSLNDADANDIAQDTFIDAFAKLNTLNDKKKFKQWICKVANNKALNLLKHNNVLKLDNIDDDNSFTEIPDKEKAAEQQVIDNEVADILKNIIEKLPLEQKITVFMFYYEDMSVKEIASAYGISENTVRSRLNYAKKFITFEINKLEDKGVKLRSTAALPFLYLIFAQEEKAFAASIADSAIPSAASVIAKTMKNSLTATSSNTVASSVISNTAASATAKVAGTAAKTFSIGKIIGISSSIVAVIAAAVIGFTMLGDKDNNKNNDKEIVSSNENDSNDNSSSNDSEDNTPSNNESNDNNESSNDENNTVYETGDEYWNYYSMDTTTLPEIKYTTIEYLQGENGPVDANIADTMFNFTPEQLTEKIKNSSLLQSKEYIFTTELEEECKLTEFADVGLQKQFTITDLVKAYPKTNVDEVISSGSPYYDFMYDVRFSLERDCTSYNNYNHLIIEVRGIDVTRDKQDEIYAMLADVLGNDLATHLVYAEDCDGKDQFKDSVGKRNLADYVMAGETTSYYLTRTLTLGKKDTPNSGTVFFSIQVTHDKDNNKYGGESYYSDNYTSALNTNLFSLDKYILGNFGSTDFNNLSSFGSEYMKLGVDDIYTRTVSDGYRYKVFNYPDGTVKEHFMIEMQKGCKDLALMVCPEFNMTISHYTKNGETIDFEAEFEGGIGLASIPENTEPDYTKLYNPLIGKLKSILGDGIDISAIDTASFAEKKGLAFESTYLDKPCKGSIAYDYGTNMAGLMTGEYRININMAK